MVVVIIKWSGISSNNTDFSKFCQFLFTKNYNLKLKIHPLIKKIIQILLKIL